MGFLSFLGKIGKGIIGGIGKLAGFVGKIAPIVSTVAGLIPHPIAQGISKVAAVASPIAEGIGGISDAMLGGAEQAGAEGAIYNGVNAYNRSGLPDQVGNLIQTGKDAFGQARGGGATVDMGMPANYRPNVQQIQQQAQPVAQQRAII
jgi:hypothetical protein